ALFQRLEQHDGAGDRYRKAEDQPLTGAPAPEMGKPHSHGGREQNLTHRASYGDTAHGEQVRSRKMEAYPEHQQDDADFGNLARHGWIGHIARRKRPEEYSGDQIAVERRQSQPVGEIAEYRRQHEAEGDGRDKVYVMWQALILGERR